MCTTEREALEAGTVWWDGELFTGAPHWPKLLAAKPPRLSGPEQAFLDGPCERRCCMPDDWSITHERADLPPQVWECLKTRGFFAMIIPKKYGGLEFSAYAHSCVLAKISSRSATVSSTVAVPNSLGPAELLNHYGTEEQKNYYLPRLARGEEVPCFALTGPRAGSDAGSIPDTGVVCRGPWQGREIVGLKLNFSKRYITLAPVATVIGLAFRSEEHTSELQSRLHLVCRLLLAKSNKSHLSHRALKTPMTIALNYSYRHAGQVHVDVRDLPLASNDLAPPGARAHVVSLLGRGRR